MAQRRGYADPSEVDGYLRQGTNAFLAKDYRATLQDLPCPRHPPFGVQDRYRPARDVRRGSGCRRRGLRSPVRSRHVHDHRSCASGQGGQDGHRRHVRRRAFLASARSDRADGPRCDDWDTDADHWRREVAQRLEGADGLAAIARSTNRSSDFSAWCQTLIVARDWKASMVAHSEAAETVSGKSCMRGDFLDGAGPWRPQSSVVKTCPNVLSAPGAWSPASRVCAVGSARRATKRL